MLQIKDLTKRYDSGGLEQFALQPISLSVQQGEFIAIMGPSGSGKSTFMNVLGCLDKASSGSYTLDGIEISELDENKLADVRNRKIGFVFQAFHLLPRSSALSNVELPMLYAGLSRKERRQRAVEALGRVGLAERINNRPNQLSGGQKQRVAIARSLVNKPAILLADEPTGNLDSRSSLEIMSIFQELHAHGVTILLVTHETDIAEHAERIITFRDGAIVSDEYVQNRRIAHSAGEAVQS